MALTLPEPSTRYHDCAAALLARLALAFKAPTFQLELMPPAPTKKEWEQITRVRPFVGLSWAGFEPGAQARGLTGDSEWIVYLVVDNAGDVAARWTGDSRGIGLFGMVTAAGHLLHGFTVDGVGSAKITSIDSLWREDWADDATAIVAIGLKVGMSPGAGFAAETVDDFLALTCAWTMPAADGSAEIPTSTLSLGA